MNNRQQQIQAMLRSIEEECRYTRGLTGVSSFRPEVMQALAEVDRALFVPDELQAHAYDNVPLPIGDGQTISQPYIVALMTELLDPQPEDRILEVGAGSGYQAAILSRLVKKIYTVEIIPALAERARKRFAELGIDNVEVLLGDGYQGLPEQAPFDGILVAAAAPHIPPPLVEQLRPTARLVIPVGQPHHPQELMLVSKDQAGRVQTRQVLSVSFVPLTGDNRPPPPAPDRR